MMDWLMDYKNEILAIGAIIVSTVFFGWLFYLVIVCEWWAWLCWTLGVMIILCWIASLFIIAADYAYNKHVQPGIDSIKDTFGILSWSDLPEAILKKWLEAHWG